MGQESPFSGGFTTPEEIDLRGTFQNFLQSQGITPGSIFGRQAQNFQDPAFGAFNVASLAGLNPSANFTEFLGNSNAAGIANLGQQGLSAAAFGGGGGGINTQELFQNASPGGGLGAFLEQSTLAALRNQLPGAVAGRFGGQIVGNASDAFGRQSAAGTLDGATLAQFLAQALGLTAPGGA